MTKHEQTLIEGRCRAALKKKGATLRKQRDTNIYFNPNASRYRIEEPGSGETATGFSLGLCEVMAAAGIA